MLEFTILEEPDVPYGQRHVEKEFDLQRGFEFLNQELDQLFPPEGNEYRLILCQNNQTFYSRG